MKVLKIDYRYYLYPKEYKDLDSFIAYINKSNDKFILLEKLMVDDYCIEPYFIEGEVYKVYVNFDLVKSIEEVDAENLR